MNELVRVAAAQINIEWLNPELNLKKINDTLEIMCQNNPPELVVFPELSNSGYVKGREQKDFSTFSNKYSQIAEEIPGPFTEVLGEYAKKFNLYIAIGMLELHPNIPATLFNSAILINPKGSLIGHYRKVHIPGEEKHYFYPGNKLEIWKTPIGNIGLMICADNSFPEEARILTLKGAEIICVCYARPKGIGSDPELYNRIVSCRAFENNNFFIACNRVGKENNLIFEGRSCICGPKGEFLSTSNQDGEDIIIADLHNTDLSIARIQYSRFRDRRPELYNDLSLLFE